MELIVSITNTYRDEYPAPSNHIRLPGVDCEVVQPVPIPNTVVKRFSADGTARVTLWESKSMPG